MEVDDKLLFDFVEEAALQVGTEIVSPTEAAALTAAAEAGELRDSPPTAMAIGEDEGNKLVVLIRSPWAFLDTKFVTARLSSHHYKLLIINSLILIKLIKTQVIQSVIP